MIRVREAAADELRWIEERTGCVLTRNARALLAETSQGCTVGMVAYDGWTPGSVQAHMAVAYPAVWRALLRPAFDYPFRFAGKEVLIGVIASDNARSVAAARAFGFTEAHRITDGWSKGTDLIIFEMRRADCRWLKD